LVGQIDLYAEGLEFKPRPRQTQDVRTGSDCSLAKHSSVRSENLLKVIIPVARSKFAALYRQWWRLYTGERYQTGRKQSNNWSINQISSSSNNASFPSPSREERFVIGHSFLAMISSSYTIGLIGYVQKEKCHEDAQRPSDILTCLRPSLHNQLKPIV
jgi:hypothetical protein